MTPIAHYNEKQDTVVVGDGSDKQRRTIHVSDIKFEACRKTAIAEAARMDETFVVQTKEGEMTGNPGDYLMRGASGELYPCAKDVFLKTYQFV